MIKIREKIIELRKKKGVSQEYIAESLNITQAAYHKIESGSTTLSVPNLIRIAEILEVCPCDLIKLVAQPKQ